MIKPKLPFASELQQKHREGNFKPSDFKKNKGWNPPANKDITNQQESPQVITSQSESELTTTKQDLPTSQSEEITKLKAERNALELALFDKRLENLQEFSHYRTRLSQLNNQEIKLTLDNNTQLVLSLLALVIFLNLLTK